MTTSPRLRAGTLLGGRYRLLGPLPGAGRGWHARDEVDQRDLVAAMVVLPAAMPAVDRDRARQWALHDAAVVSRVHHPGIAPVVDVVVEDGDPWVISVRPSGRSLADLVRDLGPMPAEVAALVGLQVLDALVAAEVPHGDLTPDDVLVSADGRVAVTGFATTRVDGTQTPGFRAPEGGPSAAADLWALGVTLYAAVEGRLPDGRGGGALRPALDRLLAVDPAQRSETGRVWRLLAEVGGTLPPEQPEISDPEVAAALAAFDAALPRPRSAPEPRPPAPRSQQPLTPPFPPTPPAARHPAPPRPADPAAGAVPAAPADRGNQAGPAGPAVPVGPAHRVDAADAPAPSEAAGSSAAAEVTDPRGHTGPPSVGPADRVEPAESPDAADLTDSRDLTSPPKSVGPSRAADPEEPVDPADPTDPTDPVDSDDRADRAEADRAEADRAGLAHPADAVDPADVASAADGAEVTGLASALRRVVTDRSGAARPADPGAAGDPPDRVTSAETAESVDAGNSGWADEVGMAGGASAVGPAGEPAVRLGERAEHGGGERAVRASGDARRSRWSWIAVVAVGLLVLAVVLPLLLNRDSKAAVKPVPEPTPTQTQTQTPEAFPAPPPTGYALYRDRAGWSIAVPKAWRATRTGSGVTFRDGDRVLTVTHHGNPPRDPYAAQLRLEPTVKTTTPGYDLMRIARVKYRDWPTADWEYRAGAGPVTHTLVRSTIPAADTVYDISWTTLDSRWTAERTYFDNAMRTFDAGA